MTIKHTPTIPSTKLIVDNLLMFWSHLDVELQFSSAYTLYFSNIAFPLFNGVISTRLTSRNARDHVERVIQYFKSKKTPFCWWLDPLATPEDLDRILAEYGLSHLGFFTGWSLKLSRSAFLHKAQNELTIDLIDDNEMMQSWLEIMQENYDLSPKIVNDISTLYSQQSSENQMPFRQFLARLNGKPVGIGTLFIYEESAGIYDLCVLPEVRCKGIGAAIVEEMLRYSEACGCRTAIAVAPSKGRGVFHPLGFQKQGQFSIYKWPSEAVLFKNPNPYINNPGV